MNKIEILINKIAQNRIEFEEGIKSLLIDQDYDFKTIFTYLRNYVFNSILNKTNYYSKTYQTAIDTIPLRQTSNPIVILRTHPIKIAFNKLEQQPRSEHEKVIKSLLWIFKETDTFRRATDCKNGCGHEWHNIV